MFWQWEWDGFFQPWFSVDEFMRHLDEERFHWRPGQKMLDRHWHIVTNWSVKQTWLWGCRNVPQQFSKINTRKIGWYFASLSCAIEVQFELIKWLIWNVASMSHSFIVRYKLMIDFSSGRAKTFYMGVGEGQKSLERGKWEQKSRRPSQMKRSKIHISNSYYC